MRASKRLYREKAGYLPAVGTASEENLSPERLASPNTTASMVAEAVSHPARCEPLTRAARCIAGHAEPREVERRPNERGPSSAQVAAARARPRAEDFMNPPAIHDDHASSNTTANTYRWRVTLLQT